MRGLKIILTAVVVLVVLGLCIKLISGLVLPFVIGGISGYLLGKNSKSSNHNTTSIIN